jgi:hypothetical protein
MSGGWGKPSKMFNDFFGSSKVKTGRYKKVKELSQEVL